MARTLHEMRALLVVGGLLAILRLELGWLAPPMADVVQGLGLAMLALAGLRIRHATSDAAVGRQTALAVTLLGLALALHVAGLRGSVTGVLAAPAWALGVLLSMWASARALADAGHQDSAVWSAAYVTGLLVWSPVAIVLGRVVWATAVRGVEGVTADVEGGGAVLVTALMLAPFLVLYGTTSSPARAGTEVAA